MGRMYAGVRAALADPRHFQLVVLGGLLVYGSVNDVFVLRGAGVGAAIAAGLATEWALARCGGRRCDPRSPLISALSIVLLLRTDGPAVLAFAAVAAIASKSVVRFGGRHVFNPSALGIAIAVLVTGRAWVSPGQWGSEMNVAFAIACVGGLVVHRALRSDVTWAFLAAYATLSLTRAAWLGDPWAVPLHALDSGALVLFAFFMISDPKTTPSSRTGRIVFASAVALGAAFVHFVLFEPNGFLWALLASAPLVPVLDRLLPGPQITWSGYRRSIAPLQEDPMQSRMTPRSLPSARSVARPQALARAGTSARAVPLTALVVTTALLLVLLASARADAFCGFYVSKADTKLFNRASQVVLVRDGDRTVLTMANDYQGDPREFALVVPVPTRIEREQIHVGDQALIDHLDAYTAPRLVEYHDPDPCMVVRRMEKSRQAFPATADAAREVAEELGVVIEAKYTVGEYDILILSAEESSGLETWLRRNGYRIPDGASRVLGSYLKQGMRFFVAKVNLDQQARLGFANLRPLQIAFEHRRFMLPIRLGTVNADGEQELFIYTLTRRGRVETTNYRTVKVPSDVELPEHVEAEFDDFYRAMFERHVRRSGRSSVTLEYAWDMNWCDPCAADPLSDDELRQLGVFWIDGAAERGGPARDAFVTRLHVRYTARTFPEDLMFQETADRTNFQGRYVLRHPWRGEARCAAGRDYLARLPDRLEREAQQLANLTGWSIEEIRRKIDFPGAPSGPRPWWQRLWPRDPGRGR